MRSVFASSDLMVIRKKPKVDENSKNKKTRTVSGSEFDDINEEIEK